MIQTIAGKMRKEDLGVTLAHEHIRVDRLGSTAKVKTYEAMLQEYIDELTPCIKQYKLHSLFDMTCIGMGREAVALQHLQRLTGLNIVCSTGFYLPYSYPQYVASASTDELVEIMLDEIREGVDHSGALPGVIGEIGSEKDEFSAIQKKVFKAAVKASQQSGLAIFTHCQLGTMVKEQAEFLLDCGADPDRIALGHCDLCNDFEALEFAVSHGFTLCFDTLGKNQYQSEETRIDRAVKLIEKGYSSQLIFSMDVTRRSYFRKNQGAGYLYLFDAWIPKLRQRGIPQEVINKILSENPGNLLDVRL